MKKLTTILVAFAAILVLSNSVNAQALQASYSVNESAPFAGILSKKKSCNYNSEKRN